MAHKFNPENKHRLDNPQRKKDLPVFKILKDAGLKQGDVLVDIGCGVGFFSLPAAQVVGKEGLVYGVDTCKELLLEVEKRKKDKFNIKTVQSGEYDFRLAKEIADFVIVAFVWHEVIDKELFLNRIKELLKDKGVLLILEWQKTKTQGGPPLEDRISKEEALRILEDSGFKDVKELNVYDQAYCLKVAKG